jgi:hypothetical protein
MIEHLLMIFVATIGVQGTCADLNESTQAVVDQLFASFGCVGTRPTCPSCASERGNATSFE